MQAILILMCVLQTINQTVPDNKCVNQKSADGWGKEGTKLFLKKTSPFLTPHNLPLEKLALNILAHIITAAKTMCLQDN